MTPSSRVCPKCGATVADGLNYCTSCGNPVPGSSLGFLISDVPGSTRPTPTAAVPGAANPYAVPVAPPPPPPASGSPTGASPSSGIGGYGTLPPPASPVPQRPSTYSVPAAPPGYPPPPPPPAPSYGPLQASPVQSSAAMQPGYPPPPPPPPPASAQQQPAYGPPTAPQGYSPGSGSPLVNPVPPVPPVSNGGQSAYAPNMGASPVGWSGPFVTPQPVAPSQFVHQVPTSVALVFDTGQRVVASGSGLLGRNPSSSDATVTCTSVSDPDMSISKVHLEYGCDDKGLWIKDRGSTNGSTITHVGQTPVPMVEGETYRLQIGDLITMGHRKITVQSAGEQ